MGSTPQVPSRVRAWASAARARLREERGAISMLEMIIGATAAGLIFTAGFFFLLNGTNRLDDTESRRTTLSEEQVVIDRMAREIREADQVTPSNPTGSGFKTVDVRRGTIERALWSCLSGTCTRSQLNPTTGAVISGPVVEIDDVSSSANEPVFTVGSAYDGADSGFITTRIEVLPEGRTRPIVLSRQVALRSG